MALRNIIFDYDSVLHTECKEVVNFDEHLKEIVNDLIETLHATEDGVGLAAPQVGILKKIAVIDVGMGPIILINPKIIEQSGNQVSVEGCLSFPNIQAKVKRPNYVKVKAFNQNGKENIYEGVGLLARAFCHEIDHLFGIVFLDRAIEII